MITWLLRVTWRLICWVELAVFTLVMYLLTWLPKVLLERFYFGLFRWWARNTPRRACRSSTS